MTRPIKPATQDDVAKVARAVLLICEARDLLREAGSNKAADKAQSALKSAEGAKRHVEHRFRRTAE